MSFFILTPSGIGKGFSVLAGYPDRQHRDESLELLREKQPYKMFVKRNPRSTERGNKPSPRETT